MSNTVQHTTNVIPYWDQLKNLSNDDKLTLISMLSESMVSEPEPFDVAIKRAISVEEFRKLCHQKVEELYGEH